MPINRIDRFLREGAVRSTYDFALMLGRLRGGTVQPSSERGDQ